MSCIIKKCVREMASAGNKKHELLVLLVFNVYTGIRRLLVCVVSDLQSDAACWVAKYRYKEYGEKYRRN